MKKMKVHLWSVLLAVVAQQAGLRRPLQLQSLLQPGPLALAAQPRLVSSKRPQGGHRAEPSQLHRLLQSLLGPLQAEPRRLGLE